MSIDEEKKDCKPGYNSCDITNDGLNEKNMQPDDPDAEKDCKHGFSSCSVPGQEPEVKADEDCVDDSKEKNCKPGFNSCDI